MKNSVSGLLMGTRVSHNKQRLHNVGYFHDLLTTHQEVKGSIRPLLELSQETIVRLHKMDYALVSPLRRDPLLTKRVKHLQTIPGVGPITALTWALEMGEVERFHSLKQAVSYCGLCGEENSSGETVKRTSISKQRNKHIQSVLVEAAKLAPLHSPELATFMKRKNKKGMLIVRPWRSRASWWLICWPWTGARKTSCRQRT